MTETAEPSAPSFDPFLDGDHPREECGVFGIYGDNDAAAHTALGLWAAPAAVAVFRGHGILRGSRDFPGAGSPE